MKNILLFVMFGSACCLSTSKDCGKISTEIINNEKITKTIECRKNGGWAIFRELNGKLHGKIEYFHPNGKLAQVSFYANNKQIGIQKGWDSTGFLSVYKPYKNGHPVDTHKVWRDKNKMKYIKIYDQDGNKHGWSRNWYENGKLQDSTLYVHGDKIEEFIYHENEKLMIHSKMKPNGFILSSESYYVNGTKSGEVKNGNGRVILPRDQFFDTLIISDGQVRNGAFEAFHDR